MKLHQGIVNYGSIISAKTISQMFPKFLGKKAGFYRIVCSRSPNDAEIWITRNISVTRCFSQSVFVSLWTVFSLFSLFSRMKLTRLSFCLLFFLPSSPHLSFFFFAAAVPRPVRSRFLVVSFLYFSFQHHRPSSTAS